MEEHGASVNRRARPRFCAGEAYQLYVSLLAALNSGSQGDEEVALMQAQAVGLAPEDISTIAVTCRCGWHEPSHIARLERAARQAAARVGSRFFADFDGLLCPVFGRPALPRMDGGVRWKRHIQVGDATVAHDEQLLWSGITCGFYLPGTVAPLVRSQDGLPIGVQIVARPHDDRSTIAVASLTEALNGGFSPPPGRE